MERRGRVCRADIEIADFRVTALDRHDILARRLAVHISLVFGAEATLLHMVETRIVQRHSGKATHVRPTITL